MTTEAEKEPSTRQAYEEARRNLRLMQELVGSEGWKLLVQIGASQMKVRHQHAATPMMKLDDVFERQMCAGEVAGIQLVLATPDSLIDDCEATVAQLKDALDNEDGREDTDGDA